MRNVITRPEDCELVDRAGDAIRDDCLDEVHLDAIVGVVGVLIDGVVTLLCSLLSLVSVRSCCFIIVSISWASSSTIVVTVAGIVGGQMTFFNECRCGKGDDDEDDSTIL